MKTPYNSVENNCCLLCYCRCCCRYCLFLQLCENYFEGSHSGLFMKRSPQVDLRITNNLCNCWSNFSYSALEISPVVLSISLFTSLSLSVHISATSLAVKFPLGLFPQDTILDLVMFSLQQQTMAFLGNVIHKDGIS